MRHLAVSRSAGKTLGGREQRDGNDTEFSGAQTWGIGRGSKRRRTSLAPTESYEIGAGASSPEPKTCWTPKSVPKFLDTEFKQVAVAGR
jgi:hypothetical protein